MRFFLCIIVAFCWLIVACTPKMQQQERVMNTLPPTPDSEIRYVSAAEIEQLPSDYEVLGNRAQHCRDPLAYAPDTNYLDHSPIKYVRINIHWMNTTDRKANRDGKEAVEFAKGLVKASNYHLRKNKKMWLPPNNDTPVLPTQIRLLLTPHPDDPTDDGIYFHYDDEMTYYIHRGKNRNLSRQDMIREYGVQIDTVLNVFLMPHHPDSVASPTYHAGNVGVALGNAIKLSGFSAQGGSYWDYSTTLNHEVAHIYGLPHAWRYDDGCDDTPRHEGDCWSPTDPGCADKTSNNVMDYSVAQKAWTPCQIGKVHLQMTRNTARARRYLEPRWCTIQEDSHIFIRDTMSWDCRKDLEGHLTIEPGGYLSMYCMTSLPKDARITIKAGGTLLLENMTLWNACEEQWDGIVIEEIGDEKGRLIIKGEVKIENALHSPELGVAGE